MWSHPANDSLLKPSSMSKQHGLIARLRLQTDVAENREHISLRQRPQLRLITDAVRFTWSVYNYCWQVYSNWPLVNTHVSVSAHRGREEVSVGSVVIYWWRKTQKGFPVGTSIPFRPASTSLPWFPAWEIIGNPRDGFYFHNDSVCPVMAFADQKNNN